MNNIEREEVICMLMKVIVNTKIEYEIIILMMI